MYGRYRAGYTIFILLLIYAPNIGHAETCLAPARPFIPNDPAHVRDYADLLRADFETYFVEVQAYFLCLDREQQRAFTEARNVAEDYEEFNKVLDR